jgi:hypothetical protein
VLMTMKFFGEMAICTWCSTWALPGWFKLVQQLVRLMSWLMSKLPTRLNSLQTCLSSWSRRVRISTKFYAIVPNFAHTFLLFQRALISNFKLFGEELRLQEQRLGDSKWSHGTSESGVSNPLKCHNFVTHFESFHLPLAPYSLVSPDFWQTYVKLQLEYIFFEFVFWIEVAGGRDTNW